MKKAKPNQNKERGITLISLIVMIAILVILSAVVIKALTSNGDIVKATADAAEDYNITSYKEQIISEVKGTIVAHAALGEEATIEKIAEDLNNETLWVKEAVANLDTSITNEDILVTTVEGYVFQVYYNSTYGMSFVEYIGKYDKKEFPTLKAHYEKSLASILTETKTTDGKIDKVELIYRGEVVLSKEAENGEMRLDVDKMGTGWYKVKSTSSNGKLRYAWIKVTTISEKLTPPIITISPSTPDGLENWYVNAPVKVNIVTDSPSASEIHYTLVGAKNQEETIIPGKEANFDITESGWTKIIAWTEDGRGYQSEEAIEEIKLDTVKPEITKAELIATKGANGWIISNRRNKDRSKR